jgi:hypothetical protein
MQLRSGCTAIEQLDARAPTRLLGRERNAVGCAAAFGEIGLPVGVRAGSAQRSSTRDREVVPSHLGLGARATLHDADTCLRCLDACAERCEHHHRGNRSAHIALADS